MTTIAVSKKHGVIACDRQFTHAGGYKFKGVTKVYEVPEEVCSDLYNHKNAYIGFAGDAGTIGDYVRWLYTQDGKPPRTGNRIEMLMLNNRREIYYSHNGVNWLNINEPFCAIGSGMHFALGALQTGATPLEAVKAASKLDPATGLGFKEYSVEDF